MKVLVFGRGGQVGGSLVELLGPEHEVLAVDKEELDLTDTDAIGIFIAAAAPEWVINASAYTAVDRAESEPELARRINADAPGAMARACARLGAGFVHYSTDYVFDGTATEPYTEEDRPNPRSVYGRTKLEGERAVLEALPEAVVLRTAWVFSRGGHNFVNTMLRLAGERDRLAVVADQFGSPTLAEDLARATLEIVDRIEQKRVRDAGGLYHATGKGETSWHGFAVKIMELAGREVEVAPIATADFPTPAPRPAWSVLSNRKLQRVFGIELPPWDDALERCLRG